MDIRLKFDSDSYDFDMDLLDNDIEKDAGLETAVIVSLFSDVRVTDTELPFGETDKKGWWADSIDPENLDKTGSKLWLLARAKQTNQTLLSAKEYVEDALQWLIDDGVASSVDVDTSYPENGHLLIEIQITKPGENQLKYSYNLVWEGQAGNGI